MTNPTRNTPAPVNELPPKRVWELTPSGWVSRPWHSRAELTEYCEGVLGRPATKRDLALLT